MKHKKSEPIIEESLLVEMKQNEEWSKPKLRGELLPTGRPTVVIRVVKNLLKYQPPTDNKKPSLAVTPPKKTGFLGIEWNKGNQLKIASMFNKGSIALGGANAKNTMTGLLIGLQQSGMLTEKEEEKGTTHG